MAARRRYNSKAEALLRVAMVSEKFIVAGRQYLLLVKLAEPKFYRVAGIAEVVMHDRPGVEVWPENQIASQIGRVELPMLAEAARHQESGLERRRHANRRSSAQAGSSRTGKSTKIQSPSALMIQHQRATHSHQTAAGAGSWRCF